MRRMLSICLLVCCSSAVIYVQIRFTDPAPIAGVAAGARLMAPPPATMAVTACPICSSRAWAKAYSPCST